MRIERTTTTKPGKTRTVALRALPVAAALALAVVAPTVAQAAPAETVRTQAVPAAVAGPGSGPVGYWFTGYYTWKSDCENRGNDGVGRGEWRGYECINGSWFSDWELWVRYW
ncbi:hypothetical protein AB0L41_12055 [Amycolatopsis mediterranei]|uniref:hypothetical protein n=1 Tax=Amycolatopsis mediterranei TaxID=33910 RepID=UPI003429512F